MASAMLSIASSTPSASLSMHDAHKGKPKLGADNPAIKEQRVATVQALSGTGSLRLAAALIERYFPGAKSLISSPTWESNHKRNGNAQFTCRSLTYGVSYCAMEKAALISHVVTTI